MISEEERYKEKLFQTMQDVGLVDNLKVQIRQKLIDKLKHSTKQNVVEPDKLFIKKLCSSLFIEFLQNNGFHYTVSVFQPESGFSNSLLTNKQLAQLFKVSTKAASGSILQTLVETFLPKRTSMAKVVSTEQQTDDPNSVQSIQLKLSMIEHSYKQRANNPTELLKLSEEREQRQLKYKNEFSKRQKEELEREIKRVRQFQANNIRIQERDKYNMLIKEYKEELEIKYKQKLVKLNEREEEVIKRVTNKMKQIQTYNYQHRQKVLKDYQYIKEKERELDIYKERLERRERQMQKQMQKK